MTKDLFDKYIWLVDTIHRAGRITLREINEKWAMSPLYDGADIPRRTFNNWKEAIQQAFDINIECRRVGGYHYYRRTALPAHGCSILSLSRTSSARARASATASSSRMYLPDRNTSRP